MSLMPEAQTRPEVRYITYHDVRKTLHGDCQLVGQTEHPRMRRRCLLN
jgi:hypothetical protein